MPTTNLDISKDKNIVIVIPDYVNTDIATACLALNQLAKINKANLQIFAKRDHFVKNLFKDLSDESVNISKTIVSKNYTIDIAKNNGVKDVSFEELEDKFRLNISSYNGNLEPEKYKLKQLSPKIDTLIFFGTDISNLEEDLPEDIEVENTVLLNYINEKTDLEVDFEFVKESSSISELLFELLLKEDFELSSDTATILLTGIVSNTSNLTINTSSTTFSNANRLVNDHSADWKKAQELAKTKISEKQSFWFSEVFSNSKQNKSLSYAVVEHENITSELLSRLSYEDKLPLLKLNNTEHSVLIIKLNNGIHGFVGTRSTNSSNSKISALDITSGFSRIGGRNFVQFWSDDHENEILKIIHKRLNLEFITSDEPKNNQNKIEKKFELSEKAKKLLAKNNGNKLKTIKEITKPISTKEAISKADGNDSVEDAKTDLKDEEEYSDDAPKVEKVEKVKPKSFFERFKKNRGERTKKEEENTKKSKAENESKAKPKNQATVLKAKDLSFVPNDYDPLPSAGE